jgi:7-cyano-7-deazaguanine synthase
MSQAAVILVSGGLDSATTLAMAREQGFDCYALSFAYGQRHQLELEAASLVAQDLGALAHRVMPIDLSMFGGSALTDESLAVPEAALDAPVADTGSIPVTYVPARNTVFLSLALAWAETLGARHLFIGANAVDYSGYPDCRPEFLQAFEDLANLATKAGVEARNASERLRVVAPLVAMTKAEIIQTGVQLGVDYALTLSCYQPDAQARACGRCDSCRIRHQGFVAAGVKDPTRYTSEHL